VVFNIFLKNRVLFQLPKVNAMMVGMSKRLKLLRSMLEDPQKCHLLAVSILTEMASSETCDLLEGCRRTRVHVPNLIINMATEPSRCSFCSGIAEFESNVRVRYKSAFADVAQTIVYRGDPPRGLASLSILSQSLFHGSTSPH